MKYLSALPFIFMLCSILSNAQEAEEVKQSYQRDIGFNTTFILQGIFQSNQTPFSLMFKQYTSEHQAIRIGVDGLFNLNKTDANTSSSSYSNTSYASFSLALGKEFQKPIDQRWTWYFGGDIVPFFSFNDQDFYQNGGRYSTSESGSYGVGLRPFLGIRFNIGPRLYLSAEANVALQYARNKNYLRYEGSDPYTDTTGNNISFSLNPATGLFMYYRF